MWTAKVCRRQFVSAGDAIVMVTIWFVLVTAVLAIWFVAVTLVNGLFVTVTLVMIFIWWFDLWWLHVAGSWFVMVAIWFVMVATVVVVMWSSQSVLVVCVAARLHSNEIGKIIMTVAMVMVAVDKCIIWIICVCDVALCINCFNWLFIWCDWHYTVLRVGITRRNMYKVTRDVHVKLYLIFYGLAQLSCVHVTLLCAPTWVFQVTDTLVIDKGVLLHVVVMKVTNWLWR